MVKIRKHSIESVREFVTNNSKCELLSTEYKNEDTKMKFRCECGEEFETTYDKFKRRNKRQCNECSKKILSEKKKLSYEDVKEFIEVTSNSGCRLLSEKYESAHSKLLIQCSCGKIYETKWNHFKNSYQRQCPECGIEKTSNSRRLDREYVRNYVTQFGCELLGTYHSLNKKINVRCNCGNVFETSFGMFRDYDIHCCRMCREKEDSKSKGENKIESWLIEYGLNYKSQYSFEDCRHDRPLKFDFAILNESGEVKILIEYDGKQHFGLGLFSDDTEEMMKQYAIAKASDETKNEYCFKRGIPLLRISYLNYPRIEKILCRSLL